MAVVFPVIGHWYRRSSGTLFEVVAVDEQDATVELQYFDGTIDEIELENWPSLLIERVRAPEDWTGSIDIDPADVDSDDSADTTIGWHDPLEILEKAE